MLVHDAVEQAVAEEFVRLQGFTLQPLLAASRAMSQALTATVDSLAQQAYEAWQRAGNTAAHHLFVTLRVSMGRSLESVLAQPDVQAALRQPFITATGETRDAIDEAWVQGAAHGLAAANQDLQIAGHQATGPVPLDQGPLNQLLDDAQANGDAAYDRFRAAITTTDPEAVRDAIVNTANAQALRARAGVDVSGKYAASAEKVAALEQAEQEQGIGLYKVWVTRFGPGTCRFCAALHGRRRNLHQAFPSNAALGSGPALATWGGPLGHPPRHPNCRCRVILWEPPVEQEEGPTLQTMRQTALTWWQALLRAIGLSRVVVPPYLRVQDGKVISVEGYTYQREGVSPAPIGRSAWARSLGGVPTPTSAYLEEARKRQAEGRRYAAGLQDISPTELKTKADAHVRDSVKDTHIAGRRQGDQ